jgi:Protein of unknown function (DUF4239)
VDLKWVSAVLSAVPNIAIVTVFVVLALGLLFILRRLWAPGRRREHNDVIGWQFGILGTTYAVIIAFMLSGVWSNFRAAEINAEAEANSLVNVFRCAKGLPSAQRDTIQELARDYANAMVNEEWPAMTRQSLSAAGSRITQQLWSVIMRSPVDTQLEQASLDHMLTELSGMTQHRRIRQLQSRSRIPGVLWTVLIVGGVMIVASSCMFGTDNFRLQFVHVFALSLFVSLVLVAIGDIDQPFQGSVHVGPESFNQALDTFHREMSARY